VGSWRYSGNLEQWHPSRSGCLVIPSCKPLIACGKRASCRKLPKSSKPLYAHPISTPNLASQAGVASMRPVVSPRTPTARTAWHLAVTRVSPPYIVHSNVILYNTHPYALDTALKPRWPKHHLLRNWRQKLQTAAPLVRTIDSCRPRSPR